MTCALPVVREACAHHRDGCKDTLDTRDAFSYAQLENNDDVDGLLLVFVHPRYERHNSLLWKELAKVPKFLENDEHIQILVVDGIRFDALRERLGASAIFPSAAFVATLQNEHYSFPERSFEPGYVASFVRRCLEQTIDPRVKSSTTTKSQLFMPYASGRNFVSTYYTHATPPDSGVITEIPIGMQVTLEAEQISLMQAPPAPRAITQYSLEDLAALLARPNAVVILYYTNCTFAYQLACAEQPLTPSCVSIACGFCKPALHVFQRVAAIYLASAPVDFALMNLSTNHSPQLPTVVPRIEVFPHEPAAAQLAAVGGLRNSSYCTGNFAVEPILHCLKDKLHNTQAKS